MADPFLGEIRVVGFNFAPVGWLPCDGRLLAISQNTALFSLLGTTYGGNGQTTFALPDLRGRVPIHEGQGPGLSDYVQGQLDGAERVALTAAETPAHSHSVGVSTNDGASFNPVGSHLGTAMPLHGNVYAPTATGQMPQGTILEAGASNPHENRQPYQVLNYVIAVQGVFPPRN